MKKLTKILSVFLVFLISLIPFRLKAINPSTIESMDHLEQFELLVSKIDETNEYYLNTYNFTAVQTELYRLLVDHFSDGYDNYNKTIIWTVNLVDKQEKEDIQKIVNAFSDDYKLFFWLTGRASYKIITSSIDVRYEFDFELVDIYKNETEFKKDLKEIVYNREVIKNLVDQQKNTYSKIKVIHDWLAINNTYLRIGEVSHTLAGALVARHNPVCEAYSEAFQMIANYVGIRSVYGTGEVPDTNSSNPNATIGHAWNYVFIVDKWYFIDTTWAKPTGGTLNHIYFLRTIPSTHIPSSLEDVPTPFTTSKYQDYNLAEFEYESSYYYEMTGSPILGYESITISNMMFQNVGVKYYNSNNELLLTPPVGLGKYYIIATPKSPSILTGDIVIHFEIVPLMRTVNFYDYFDNLVKVEKVIDGGSAVGINLEVNGYKFISWDQDISKVESNLDVRPIFKEVEIKFFDELDHPLTVELSEISKEAIKEINYQSNNENLLFVGWGIGSEVVIFGDKITDDYNLKPILEEVKFKVEKATIKDDVYHLNKRYFKKEKITLSSGNQIIISQEVISELDDDNNYQIKLVVGSENSLDQKIIFINLVQNSYLIFNLTMQQVILYSIIGIGAFIIIGAVISVIKRRR